MPIANVRGANINYEVLGTSGPWIALSPGGRRALDHVKSLARHVADAGYRVLIHDRRNCGVSDIVIGGDQSEYEIWADDLYRACSCSSRRCPRSSAAARRAAACRCCLR